MANVVTFKGGSHFRDLIQELLECERQGLVTDLVLTYRRNYSKEETEEGVDVAGGMMCRYWFGETSAIFCLGLWANMRHIIERYINGEDLISGDD